MQSPKWILVVGLALGLLSVFFTQAQLSWPLVLSHFVAALAFGIFYILFLKHSQNITRVDAATRQSDPVNLNTQITEKQL